MNKKGYDAIMRRTGEAWRQLDFAKPFLYENLEGELADKICQKLYEAQQIIFEAENLLPDPSEKEAD